MKIGICGPGMAGKDTVATELASILGLRYFAGTSKWAAQLVFERIGRFYRSVEDCWNDRRNHREEWARIIGEYNSKDPVALYRDCLKDQDFLTGIRWKHEFRACAAEGLVDLWIYVSREGCKDSTCQVTPQDCDLTIVNDGTLGDLNWKLGTIGSILRSHLDKENRSASLVTPCHLITE